MPESAAGHVSTSERQIIFESRHGSTRGHSVAKMRRGGGGLAKMHNQSVSKSERQDTFATAITTYTMYTRTLSVACARVRALKHKHTHTHTHPRTHTHKHACGVVALKMSEASQ